MKKKRFFESIQIVFISINQSRFSNFAMAKSLLANDRISRLKAILIQEARLNSMSNPLEGLPSNHYDEIWENVYLGDW